MPYHLSHNLLDKHPIISDQIKRPALAVVLQNFEKTLAAGVAGEVAEFGCYIGTTSLFLRRLLDAHETDKILHVYDSFEGLPPKDTHDSSVAGDDFKAGELSVSKKQLISEFKKANLRAPIVHKGWFSNLSDKDVPEQLAYAFLDGDFYGSIIDSLRLVWPRLSPGGIITIDDYQRETLPGVERAVRDYFQDKQYTLASSHNIAVIGKPL